MEKILNNFKKQFDGDGSQIIERVSDDHVQLIPEIRGYC